MAFENDELKSKVDIIGTIEHRFINSEYRLCLPQEKRQKDKKKTKWENEREPSWKRGWTPKYREIFTHINDKKAPRRFACSAKNVEIPDSSMIVEIYICPVFFQFKIQVYINISTVWGNILCGL